MTGFRGAAATVKFKAAVKAAFIFTAVLILTAFSGCGLFGGTNKNEEELTISESSLSLVAGESVTLTAVSPEGREINWISSDGTIVSVEKDGKGESCTVTGVSAGSATVTANDGKKMADCEVTVTESDGRKIVWRDEFDGDTLDTSKWGFQTGTRDYYGNDRGPQYWGNEEMQYYTDGANISVADGALTITAKREAMPDGRQFSSARLATRDKFSITYGYIEARIKSPAIEGMWPAFWMLPQPSDDTSSHNEYGGWPANGEIDIMEAKGRLLNKVDATLHFGKSGQHDYTGTTKTLDTNIDEWHTYAIDWREDYIAWIIDGEEVNRVESSRWWTGASEADGAPFDKPFYILLNLAVGGTYDGRVAPPEGFTQADMSIDYVRVYE